MKRILLALVLASLAATLLAQTAVARSVLPQYRAQMAVCHPRAGKLYVQAHIAPIRGAKRVGFRFELQRRAPGDSRFNTVDLPVVHGPSFGVWEQFAADTSVRDGRGADNIQLRGAYRMRVGFRWYGTRGRILRSRAQVTPSCHVPDRRPNLRVLSLEVEHVDATQDRYFVDVINDGLAAADPFVVKLSSAMNWDRHRRIVLRGGSRHRVIVFTAPTCVPGEPPVALVDADDAVNETNEQDNSFQVTCPSA